MSYVYQKLDRADYWSLGNSLFEGLCLASTVPELDVSEAVAQPALDPSHHLSTEAFFGQFPQQGVSPYGVVCFAVVS